jgi:voltage-gated hydrogen channel 1
LEVNIRAYHRNERIINIVAGIAVGAGEIQADTTRLLKNTQTQLAEANSALALARRENQELKSRIMELES